MNCKRQNGEVVQGCHMFVEASMDGRWVVMDAMYDLHYVTAEGKPASLELIKANWNYYQQQPPQGFPADWYTYQDYSYTNWNKIPIILPALREIARWIIGDEVDTLSLRTYVIVKYQVLHYLLAFIWILASLVIFVKLFKPRRGPAHGALQ